MIKSAEEIEVIKHSARIGDLGGEAIKAAITEGISEYEVALIGTEAMVHEIAKTFPDQEIRDTWVWFQSGINTDGAHNWATTRKIRKGDILSLNCFPMPSGYYTALERTLFYGEPDERSLELWNVNVEVHKRGIELIKPGAVCKDIAAELNEIYYRARTLRQTAPSDMGTPSVCSATTTVVRPGSNCVRTSTPSSNRAWSSPWSR